MKIHKPIYDAGSKVYTCEVSSGLRFDLQVGEVEIDPLQKAGEHTEALFGILVEGTKGWFTKPLTLEYLKTKLKHHTESPDVDQGWEGVLGWEVKGLVISKESFLIKWALTTKVPKEKVVIDLEDDVKSVHESDLSLTTADPLAIGPTRRILQKKAVLNFRARAARALFKAEHLTQEYCKLYGETDWEGDSQDD